MKASAKERRIILDLIEGDKKYDEKCKALGVDGEALKVKLGEYAAPVGGVAAGKVVAGTEKAEVAK